MIDFARAWMLKSAASLLVGSTCLLQLVSGLEVELRELYNPAEVYLFGGNDDSRCSPDGCVPVFTRDRSTDASRYWACYQASPDDWRGSCQITYGFSEDEAEQYVISRVLVAFHPETNGTVDIYVDGDYVLTFEAEEGTSEFQEITGLAGYTGAEIDITGANSEGDWLAILETEIYLEVDDVPVVGITAADRVGVTASATVNDDSAVNTLDGSTAEDPSWSCSTGDVCEIVYDLVSPQSIEQIRIAFAETSGTEGATFNVYYGTSSGAYSPVLEGVAAGQRDASIVGLQTYGDARGIGRFVKIEGIPGSGGQFSLAEVDIRLREYEPQYPVDANPAWVESGKLPYGGDSGSSAGVPFDPRPSSEGGCSYGHIEGCDIYYIKDGANADESRWSCSPQVNQPFNDICQPQFLLNTFRYLRQIKLAFYKGDQRHNEFSIRVRTPYGWALAVPSAITSGDTTDYQTFDLNAWTNAIIIQPRFAEVDQWISIKEMVLLEREQGSTSSPILSFDLSAADFSSDVLSSDYVENRFKFDLDEVGDEASIQVGGDSQMSLVSAVAIKFPSNRVFTFDINYSVDDGDVTDTFTSAGGSTVWETFSLSQEAEVRFLSIVAVEGPDDFPALRVSNLKVIGGVVSTGVNHVVSTTIKEWGLVTDYIGDGTSDQEEIMRAICDAAGQGFDGTDCDGVVTGTPELNRVQMVPGNYYLDGPVFLKSGVDLVGQWSDDSPGETSFILHGDISTTGADGIINADGVTGVQVSEIVVTSNAESDGEAGVVGNVCFDVKDSEDITMEQTIFSDCSVSTNRWVDSSRITMDEYYGTEDMMIVQRVSDMSIEQAEIYGMLIEDSVGILVAGIYDEDEYYAYEGFLGAPQEADQSANLVITGSSSEIYLKDLKMLAGAEPRMVLESMSPVTLENVNFEDAEDGECLIEVPDGAGEYLVVLISPPNELVKSGNCYVLA